MSNNNNVNDTADKNDDNNDNVITLSTAMKLSDMIRHNVLYHQQLRRDEKNRLNNDSDTNQQQQQQQQFQPYIPGLWQGGLMMIVCIGVCLPVRQRIIQYSNKFGFGTIFPDLVITPFMAVTTVQLGFYSGSIYGSLEHLHQLNTIPISSSSLTRDSICQDDYMKQLIIKTTTKKKMNNKVNNKNDFDIDNYTIVNDEDDNRMLQNFDEEEKESEISSFTNVVSINKPTSTSWDPRQQTLFALQESIIQCRQRNYILSKQQQP